MKNEIKIILSYFRGYNFETHKLIIRQNYNSFKLLLDDFEVKAVTGYELKCGNGEDIPELTLTLAVIPEEIEIN